MIEYLYFSGNDSDSCVCEDFLATQAFKDIILDIDKVILLRLI